MSRHPAVLQKSFSFGIKKRTPGRYFSPAVNVRREAVFQRSVRFRNTYGGRTDATHFYREDIALTRPGTTIGLA
jgi:hypothetical protein